MILDGLFKKLAKHVTPSSGSQASGDIFQQVAKSAASKIQSKAAPPVQRNQSRATIAEGEGVSMARRQEMARSGVFDASPQNKRLGISWLI